MIKKKLIEENINQILAHSAGEIVLICKELCCRVKFCKKCIEADGCSFLQILSLAAEAASEIEIVADGLDEKRAIDSIVSLFEEATIPGR